MEIPGDIKKLSNNLLFPLFDADTEFALAEIPHKFLSKTVALSTIMRN